MATQSVLSGLQTSTVGLISAAPSGVGVPDGDAERLIRPTNQHRRPDKRIAIRQMFCRMAV
ncbi:hypothetical protein AL479_05620 [Citrobacter amalonaticus]|nr:hypothetical protein AL479_05620 [Citrobacter amalonaticus]